MREIARAFRFDIVRGTWDAEDGAYDYEVVETFARQKVARAAFANLPENERYLLVEVRNRILFERGAPEGP